MRLCILHPYVFCYFLNRNMSIFLRDFMFSVCNVQCKCYRTESGGGGTKSKVYQILLNLYNFLHGLQATQKLCLHKLKGQGPSLFFNLLSFFFFHTAIYPLLPAYINMEEKSIQLEKCLE